MIFKKNREKSDENFCRITFKLFDYNKSVLYYSLVFLKKCCLLLPWQEADHRIAWIGLRKGNPKEKYVWVDEIEGVYFNWMINAPNKLPDADCVEMIPGGEWINILCYSQRSFVCKKGNMHLKGRWLFLNRILRLKCSFLYLLQSFAQFYNFKTVSHGVLDLKDETVILRCIYSTLIAVIGASGPKCMQRRNWMCLILFKSLFDTWSEKSSFKTKNA